MKLNLGPATVFYNKFTTSVDTPVVLSMATVNPKCLRGKQFTASLDVTISNYL